METKLLELKQRLAEVYDMQCVSSLLRWDQSTYMPAGGTHARSRQIGLLRRLAHERFTDAAVGRLLDELRPYEESQPYESDDASLIRVTRRRYERNVKVPASFMARLSEHSAESYEAWVQARPADDFVKVQPYLEKTLDLSRQLANYFPGYEHIADPLIDNAEYGMKASTLRAIFTDLRSQLVPIVQAITSQPPADDTCLHLYFPEDKQLAFGIEVVKQFGYDLNRGRQDKTRHPFMTKFSLDDVRITTRVREYDLGEAIFSTMHESGHAMYEQGINPVYEGTPLANGTSSGVHESQSRTWENLVGRSWVFWTYAYPHLQAVFADQLAGVPLEVFYRAINKVQRSLIRTDADEVTYNLHPILRFELELQLLEGVLEVRDLSEAWRARYTADIGITPTDDRDGVLQDVHWYSGVIGGAFQGYTLGNILGAQFYAAALKAHPEIPQDISNGEFGTLRRWLAENIYQHGAKFTSDELIERVTGQALSTGPYIDYIKRKYGQLYNLG